MSGALTRNFKSEKTSRKRSASPVKREVLKRQKSNDAQESPVPQCDPSVPSPFKTPTKATRTVDVLNTSSPLTNTTPSSRSVYAKARAALRLSYADESAPLLGRIEQRKTLLDFLAPRFPELCSEEAQDPSSNPTERVQGGAMYISGKPGSGKTVLVTELTRNLPQSQGAIVNCTTVANIWTTLCQLLNPDLKLQGKQARLRAQQLVTERQEPFLLILDEIDQLKPASDLEVLYNLATEASLTLIGIANTLTLSTSLPASTISLDFPPYDAAEMSAIAKQRLESAPCSVITNSAIELASRKVAAGPADLRSFLALLRRTIELVEASAPNQTEPDKVAEATPKQVLAAIKIVGLSAAAQPKSIVETALANAGLMQRLALIGICVALDRAQTLNTLPPLQPKFKASPVGKNNCGPATVNYEEAWSAYNDCLRAAEHAEFIQSRNDWESLLDSLVVCGILNSDVILKSPTSASKRPSPRRNNSNSNKSRTKRASGAQLSLVHGQTATVEALCSGGEAAAIARGVWEEEQRRKVRRRRTWATNEEAPMAGFHGDGLDDKEDVLVGRRRQTDEHEDDLAYQ